MDSLLNANEIAEKISFYENLALILIILAIVFTIVSVALWFVLKISHSIRVISGVGVDKEIKKISEDTQHGNVYSKQSHKTAALSWNTSGLLDKEAKSDETQLLEDDGTALLVSDETQLLGDQDATTILGADPDATTVLGADLDATTVLGVFDPDATTVLTPGACNGDFEIEEEIVITGNQTKGN